MTLEKLELEMNETATIDFNVVISGQSIFASKPKINFIITEINSGKEWIFPSSKTKNGVTINIPIMKDIVSFTEKYLGELKVVVENRVFYPTRVNVIFYKKEHSTLLADIMKLKNLN